MNFTLTTTEYGAMGIFGTMTSEDGAITYATLEHAYKTIGSGSTWVPKIVRGHIYTCVPYLSPKRGYKVYMLEDVPDHTAIEIHIGNYNDDSDGCILIGANKIHNMITRSAESFKAFMALQAGLQFNLTVK